MGKDLKGKELGVGLSQEKSGLYVARFVDRFGKRQSKRFKKLQEARQWIANATYTDKHSNLNAPTDMIVDAWFEYWIDMKKKTVRPGSVKCYAERYNCNIKGVIGSLKIADVKPMHCQKIFNDMAGEGYCTTTMNLTRVILFNMLELAKENDIIMSNPCKRLVRSDIGRESEKKEVLTKERQRLFLQEIEGHRYENHFKFVLQTGLRIGELSGLKWEDIDFAKRNVKIQRTIWYNYKTGMLESGPPKSKSGYRTVPLTAEAIAILKHQENNRGRNDAPIEWTDHVFVNDKGFPVRNCTYDRSLLMICEKIGIPRFSMHTLRHTFATRCIEGGMKPKTLQMILGHSNIGITMNLYVHTTEEEKVNEIELVEHSLLGI
ncbi:MAG: site-specific integrase [Clostridium sp.]|nr:site-specific integrase [Clostridium sp.]MCM1207482.1 site-specific integrase [Ruminococcus sp.]